MAHHRAHHPSELVDRLTLGAQGHKDASHHDRVNATFEDEVHHGLGLIDRQIAAGGECVEGSRDPSKWSKLLLGVQSHQRSWFRRPRAIRPSWT